MRTASREGKHHEPLLMSPGGTIRSVQSTENASKDVEKNTTKTNEVSREKFKVKPPPLAETIAASLEKLALATESLKQANVSDQSNNATTSAPGPTSAISSFMVSPPDLSISKSSPSLPLAPPPTGSGHFSAQGSPRKKPSEYTPIDTTQASLSAATENYWLAATPSPSSTPSSPAKSMFDFNDGKSLRRELFGGAISCILNEEYIDVSDLRQVPDNQEVFMHKESNSTIVVEVLEYQENVRNEQACQYFYDDLCSANEADQAEILSQRVVKGTEDLMPRINSSFPRCILLGR